MLEVIVVHELHADGLDDLEEEEVDRLGKGLVAEAAEDNADKAEGAELGDVEGEEVSCDEVLDGGVDGDHELDVPRGLPDPDVEEERAEGALVCDDMVCWGSVRVEAHHAEERVGVAHVEERRLGPQQRSEDAVPADLRHLCVVLGVPADEDSERVNAVQERLGRCCTLHNGEEHRNPTDALNAPGDRAGRGGPARTSDDGCALQLQLLAVPVPDRAAAASAATNAVTATTNATTTVATVKNAGVITVVVVVVGVDGNDAAGKEGFAAVVVRALVLRSKAEEYLGLRDVEHSNGGCELAGRGVAVPEPALFCEGDCLRCCRAVRVVVRGRDRRALAERVSQQVQRQRIRGSQEAVEQVDGAHAPAHTAAGAPRRGRASPHRRHDRGADAGEAGGPLGPR